MKYIPESIALTNPNGTPYLRRIPPGMKIAAPKVETKDCRAPSQSPNV